MAIIFLDSFSHYASADILRKWDANDVSFPWTIMPTAGRRGGGAVKQGVTDANGGNPLTKFLPNLGSIIFGQAMYSATLGPTIIIQLFDNTTRQVALHVQTDGAFAVTNGFGTLLGTSLPGKYIAGTWQYVEAKFVIHGSTGSVTVRVNGEIVLYLAGIITKTSSNAYCTSVRYSIPSPFSNTAYMADLYVCDTTGTINNDFLGDSRIDVLLPTAPGSYAQLTPSSGTVHWSLLAEPIVNTTNFVSGNISGNKESYQFSDLPTAVGTIKGIQINNMSLKDDAGDRGMQNLTKIGGVENLSANIALKDSWYNNASIIERNPVTSSPWLESEVNDAEFGFVIV